MKETAHHEKATWHKPEETEGAEWEPWPHPCSSIRPPQAAMPHPFGPIGLLVEEVVKIDGRIDDDFNLFFPKEQMVPVLRLPFQHLGPTLLQIAARARTMASFMTKKINRSLDEIDEEATKHKGSDLSEHERHRVRLTQIGAALAKDDLYSMGLLEEEGCQYCGAQVSSYEHVVWHCPHFHEIRKSVDATIADMSKDCWTAAVKRGVAPAMKVDPKRTSWGRKPDYEDEEANTMMGVSTDVDADVWMMLNTAAEGELNARQLADMINERVGQQGLGAVDTALRTNIIIARLLKSFGAAPRLATET